MIPKLVVTEAHEPIFERFLGFCIWLSKHLNKFLAATSLSKSLPQMSWTMRPSALFTSKQFTSLAKIHPAVRLTTFSTLVQWNSQHPSRYGCTRPHAVPYWFWHAGSQKTFPSDIARSDIFIRARSDLVIHGGASCHGGTSLVLRCARSIRQDSNENDLNRGLVTVTTYTICQLFKCFLPCFLLVYVLLPYMFYFNVFILFYIFIFQTHNDKTSLCFLCFFLLYVFVTIHVLF